MLGGTSDISQLFEHRFYYWVMFKDEPIQYPNENTVLGRYLGPEIDVGPEMTSKIMKLNGEVVHRLIYRGLKEDDKSNKTHIYLRKEFDKSIRDRLGQDISPDEFPDFNLEDTPLYEIYEDDNTNVEHDLSGKTEGDGDAVTATGLD